MYKRLVVPLDGSDIAERALAEAENIAGLTQAPLHLVRVVDFSGQGTAVIYGNMTDSSAESILLDDEVESAREYLESVAKRIVSHGNRASCEVRRGSVAGELIAASRPGDLYVIASHGRTGLTRWFMGSVAEEVVRRSIVSVLLVKASSYTESQAARSPIVALSNAKAAPTTRALAR